MISAKLLKVHRLQAKLRKEKDEAFTAYHAKRMAWNQAWLDYLDEAERCGVCRYCLLPLSEGKHEGEDHTEFATPASLV